MNLNFSPARFHKGSSTYVFIRGHPLMRYTGKEEGGLEIFHAFADAIVFKQ